MTTPGNGRLQLACRCTGRGRRAAARRRRHGSGRRSGWCRRSRYPQPALACPSRSRNGLPAFQPGKTFPGVIASRVGVATCCTSCSRPSPMLLCDQGGRVVRVIELPARAGLPPVGILRCSGGRAGRIRGSPGRALRDAGGAPATSARAASPTPQQRTPNSPLTVIPHLRLSPRYRSHAGATLTPCVARGVGSPAAAALRSDSRGHTHAQAIADRPATRLQSALQDARGPIAPSSRPGRRLSTCAPQVAGRRADRHERAGQGAGRSIA